MRRPQSIQWLVCALAFAAPAVSADRVYVSNEDGQSVSVIDTARNEVVATIAVGKRPRGLKLNRDGTRLYVAVSGLPKCPPWVPDDECAKLKRDLTADGVAVVDTASQRVLQVLKAGSDPEQFDLSADGKRLFVANEDVATTTVLEIDSGNVLARVPVGREPEGVATSPDGRWVLVTNESDNSISFIDAGTLKVVRSVKVGKRPRDIAFTPDGGAAYVSGELDASVYRIGMPDGKPVERVIKLREKALPMGVVLDPKRNRLYVSTGRGGTVAVIDLAGRKLVTEIEVGKRPWGIALSADGERLYTANGPSNDVSVVDLASLKVIERIPVGESPWGLIIGPAPRPSGQTTHEESAREPARAVGVAFDLCEELGHALPALGLTKQCSAFTGQVLVPDEGRCLDEIFVTEPVGHPVDDAGALIQVCQLSALHDTLVDVLDPRVGRVVVSRRITLGRSCGRDRPAKAEEQSQGCARVA